MDSIQRLSDAALQLLQYQPITGDFKGKIIFNSYGDDKDFIIMKDSREIEDKIEDLCNQLAEMRAEIEKIKYAPGGIGALDAEHFNNSKEYFSRTK